MATTRSVAIYEPEPRICGPDTWAGALRAGFRQLGHRCDVVAVTSNGHRAPRWGRIEREKGSTMSCSLVPDQVVSRYAASELLDGYDLIVLTDVKTPAHDKRATDSCEPWPEYVEILSETRTPFASALHGRWYYEEHERPEGLSGPSGSPYIGELLASPNFTGFLLRHADGFCDYCARLRASDIRTELLPLPYIPRVSDELAESERYARSLGVIGRIIPTKHRHVVNEMLGRGLYRNSSTYYGGSCSCTHGPSETFMMVEQLGRLGFEHDWPGGTRRNAAFTARHREYGAEVTYRGCYEQPWEVLSDARVHVGITDCDFSGGLLEFATLEAIDCGCSPLITRPFVPHAHPERYDLTIWERSFRKYGFTQAAREGDALFAELSEVVDQASRGWTLERARANRIALRELHDPRRHALALLRGTGLVT